MATQPITITVEESTKARILQAAQAERRTVSNMANRLIELGLEAFWKGAEPNIPDPVKYLMEHKEK